MITRFIMPHVGRRIAMVCGIMLMAALSAWPNTWYVALPPYGADSGHDGTSGWDQAFATISNANAKASSSDMILVTNGTYMLAASLIITKTIDLQSANGPNDTIIDGSNAVRCVDFQNTTVGSSTNTKIQGFTIRNGNASDGPGVRVEDSGATIHNCIISSNRTTYAVRVAGESTLITETRIENNPYGGVNLATNNCTMRGCTIANNAGLGINLACPKESTNVLFDTCVIKGNTNTSFGGGINMVGAAVFTNCLFANNYGTRGGGIYGASGGTGVFWGCTVASNQASGEGGGGYITFNSEFIHCRIMANTGTQGGGLLLSSAIAGGRAMFSNCWFLNNYGNQGGACYDSHHSVFYNCLIAGNSAGGGANPRGGGIHTSSANTSQFWNCTIASNVAPDYGGGLWFGGAGAGVHMVNTILYDNYAATSGSNWFRNAGNLYLTNSCTAPLSGTGYSGENNTDSNPLFVDPAGGDFRIRKGSPCINTGLTTEWMANARDLDGRARLDRFSRRVDMGAYEFLPSGMLISVH